MSDFEKFKNLSTTVYADGLTQHQYMDLGIRPLWEGTPRIAGPAVTVQLHHCDHLMLHSAIYEAPPGSVIVVRTPAPNFAVAGGNVCWIAQQQGIAGFVVDGAVRDLEEIRQHRFPVYARGVFAFPGKKNIYTPINIPINCGGVNVSAGDLIVADEDGIAVVPQAKIDEVYEIALKRDEKDRSTSLEDWREAHRKKVQSKVEQLKQG